VGVSNFVDERVARAVVGAAAGDAPMTFTIRPEKFRLAEPAADVPDGMVAADGHIRDVVYLGMYTRYLVELDLGGDLTVVAQNLESTSMEALATRGRRVRLLWQRSHNRPVAARN